MVRASSTYTLPRPKMNALILQNKTSRTRGASPSTLPTRTTTKPNPRTELLQQGKNIGYALATTVRKLVRKFTHKNQQVRFAQKPTVARFHKQEETITITYDSGADNHYMSEADRIGLGLPILWLSHKHVAVSNGVTRKVKYVIRLPFPQLSTTTSEADMSEAFPSSLMSVGKTSNDGNVPIFTNEKVKV